jgi:hypothetical protein
MAQAPAPGHAGELEDGVGVLTEAIALLRRFPLTH